MKKTMNEIFSTNLRNALYMAGKNQADLAKAVSVTETSVSHWVNGNVVPRPNKIDQIARALNCTREDLMLDHERTIMLAPEDVLADEMRKRTDLYGLFNLIMRLTDSDIKLISSLVERISK